MVLWHAGRQPDRRCAEGLPAARVRVPAPRGGAARRGLGGGGLGHQSPPGAPTLDAPPRCSPTRSRSAALRAGTAPGTSISAYLPADVSTFQYASRWHNAERALVGVPGWV